MRSTDGLPIHVYLTVAAVADISPPPPPLIPPEADEISPSTPLPTPTPLPRIILATTVRCRRVVTARCGDASRLCLFVPFFKRLVTLHLCCSCRVDRRFGRHKSQLNSIQSYTNVRRLFNFS